MNTLPVVCLHGFLGDGRDFDLLRTSLEATGRRVLSPDIPGHGREPEPITGRGNPFFAVVEHLAAKLQLEGATRFHVVGYSMGGRLAYALLTKYPDRIASAVTIGASPGIVDQGTRTERARTDRALSAQLESEGLPRFLESWYALPLFNTLRDHPAFPGVLDRRREGQVASLAAALRALSPGIMPDLTKDLARTDVPITVVAGEHDKKYVGVNAALATANPRHIDAQVVDGAGHAVHVERPDVVAALVAAAIDGNTT